MTHAETRADMLEKRLRKFARDVRLLARDLERNTCWKQDIGQLIRSSGSIAANYIEARESLSKRDFLYRIRICRKEARETSLWLELLKEQIQKNVVDLYETLLQENSELIRIFTAAAKTMQRRLLEKEAQTNSQLPNSR